MELNTKLLACSRKLRAFRFNFEKLFANVQCNQVQIVTAAEFRVIDILDGHHKPIHCIDVSQITKTVVSYSDNLLIVHTLVKDTNAQQDQTIFSGEFKWKENWRCEIKIPVRNLNLSPIGDFLVLSGQNILTVWSRDSETLQSFSNIIYYSKDEAKHVMASVIKQIDLGDIMQSEIARDGRLIIFLEANSNTINILYQDKVTEPIKEQKAAKKEDTDAYGRKQNQYNPSKKIAVPISEYNPYADIVPLSAEELEQSKQQEMKFKIQDLSLYQLQKHKNTIEYFKILQHDLLESEKRHLANVILTVTTRNEVYMWQENLACSDMQFVCAHIFRGYAQTPYFDVSFVEFPPVNPKLFHEVQTKVSKIFDTSNDKVLRLKKEDNKLGIYQNNYHEKTLDWILILKDSIMEVYKVECLRNFPCRNIQVTNFNRIRMNSSPRDFHGVCKIYSSSCRDLNDVISIYCLNSSFQLIKFRKNFMNQNQDNQALVNGHAHHLWRLDKISIINQRNIRDILVHPQLPFVAYVMNSDEMYFFIEEENSLQIVRTNEMKFAGAYSIHHLSHHMHHHDGQDNHFIKKAKWVKGLCQMMILYSNNAVGLLSSFSLLRILANGKHPEEYLKIWKEKKGLMDERWDRLYEIEFQPDNGKINEKIVDFEILDTKLNPLEGSFAITLVIFTDQYQQYVYQIETKFLEQGLKTISSSVQLLSTQTDDCLVRMLSSFSGFHDEKRTSMVLLTEIDPINAPLPQAIEVVVEQPVKKKGKFEYSDDEDDDGDIFSQFNKKPKQEKKQEVKVIQPPAPTKREVRVKFITFEMDESGSQVSAKEEWKVEVPLEFKNKEVLCRMNRDLIGLLVKEGEAQDKTLYLYEITSSRYLGFINLSELLKLPTRNMPLDFVFSSDKVKGSIIVFVNNNLYLISQSAKNGQSGKWSVIQVIKQVTGLEQVEIESTKIYESYHQKLIFLINEKYIKIKSKFNVSKIKEADVLDQNKQSTNQIFAMQQKSFALFDPKLLEALYIKGYSKLVLKILVKLQQAIQISSSRQEQISDFLDFDIEQIFKEIEDHIKEQSDQSSTKTQVKKQTASSMFDDFYDGGGDLSPKDDKNNKKEEKKGQTEDQKMEAEFEENFDKFAKALRQKNSQQLLGYTQQQVKDLNAFIQKFRGLYKKDFFAGTLADILLREIFVPITYQLISCIQLETEEYQEVEDPDGAVIPQNVQPLNILQMMNNLRTQAKQSKGSISLLQNWNSFKVSLALISENQDVIVNEIQERFDFENNFNWEVMKKLCIPLWLKDVAKLKVLTEKVAKGEYKGSGDEFGKSSRAEKVALWYILLGKKQQLCSLYKIEPQYKKVYELLLNDFNEPKYKTTAEKNAMILMSKQNYLLAAAFFLLAKNLKSALQVALGRLNDPTLGVLMCRVFEGEDSAQLQVLYQEQFIDRGEKIGDPYMVCLGRWLKKEYIKSINAFKIEGGGGSNLLNMLKPGLSAFDIAFIKELEERTQVISIADAQANAQIKSTVGDSSKSVSLPIATQYDYFALDIIRAMKKLPAVKRELKSGGVVSGGGGDAFDFDSWGRDSKVDKAKEEEAKKKKEENKLQIDEAKILQLVSYDASQSGLPVISLAVLSENEEFIDNVEQSFKISISKTIINDLSHSFNQHIDFTQQVQKANNSIRVLSEKFQINESAGKNFIIKQCDQMGLIGLEISFYLDMKMDDVSFRLEDYAIKLIDFVHSLTDFPFILDAPTTNSASQTYSNKEKAKQASKILPILSNLEQIVECLLGFSFQPINPSDTDERPPHQQFISVNQAVSNQKGGASGLSKTQVPSKGQPKHAGLNHSQSGRSYSIVSLNNPDHDINYQFSMQGPDGSVQFQDMDAANMLLGSQDLSLNPDLDKALAKLNSKIRTILVVYLTLISICFATRKFQFVPSLLSVLRNVLQYQQAGNTSDSPDQKLEKAFKIDYQQLKIKIQKIKYAIQNVEEEPVIEEAKEVNAYMEMSGKTGEEKKDAAPTDQDIKIQEFYALWFRYIIAYNTCFVLKSSYQNSQIQSLINIRPSMVNSRKIQEVIVSIINQRLQSSELLKKLENMYRILENVTSYYFEQFLTMKDRKAIVDSLIHTKDSVTNTLSYSYFNQDFKKNIPTYITNMFEQEKKFFKFAQFMDLKTFIQYLKEHELSLVYHTVTRDSNNPYPVERSKELFQTGIDLFRLKGEPIQQFTFDRCGRDIAAIAMLNKGIREIPVQKTLLCRNRMNNGLTLIDEELNTWNECLHRYDKYPIPNTNNDPIIAVIDKIYRQKTVHFIRVDKRKKTNTLIDYEVSPPDQYGGLKAQEFLKVLINNDQCEIIQSRSNLEVLHEDYTYAIDAHPYLPLYMSGNAKGLLNLWAFEQENDRALDQWVTELDQKNAIPKKATIKKIAFSGYGDKVACCNMEGSFFIYNFEVSDQSKMMPIFNLKKTKDQKFNDFEYLNEDTVVAMTSLKPKKLWIFDTLIPQKNGLVIENNMGGNLLLACKAKQQIYTFNERPGQISVFDIRTSKIMHAQQLHNEEVTAVTMNEAQDSIVAGFKDGTVKILSLTKGEFETRESQMMFSTMGNKKGAVTHLKLHPTNGALYASSITGNFKLLRTKV